VNSYSKVVSIKGRRGIILKIYLSIILTLLLPFTSTNAYDFGSKSTYIEAYSIDTEYAEKFGLGIGETGWIYFYCNTTTADAITVVAITGPTGFAATVIEANGSIYTSNRFNVGSPADTLADLGISGGEGAVIGAVMAGASTLNPYGIALGGVVGFVEGVGQGLIRISSDTSENYDVIFIYLHPARRGTYAIRVDNPFYHPWSLNSVKVKVCTVNY
jgi:hypothetical protein